MVGRVARRLPLLELDPDLAPGLDERRQALALRHLLVRVEHVSTGEWRPETDEFGARDGVGLLLAEGLALRRVSLAHRAAAELLGPGDVLRPSQSTGGHSLYPFSSTWRVVDALAVAVLDPALTARLVHFPEIVGELVGRGVLRSQRAVGSLAVAELTSVDNRLLVALWHLADEWGRVRPDGVLLPIALTHEMLGLLVGARRPSVTAALGRLAQRGLVAAQRPKGWLLTGRPPAELVRASERGAADDDEPLSDER